MAEDEGKMWGVRGVSEDIKAAALREAKKTGINVGEWLAIAIREKIKADRSGSRALTVKQEKKPVNIQDDSAVLEMLDKLKNLGVEPSESLKKQAQSLVRQCMTDVKRGSVVVEQK